MLTDGRQFREYLFNREVVTLMISMIKELGLLAHQLVPEENDLPISTRVARANKQNKTNICVLVAVHSNAYGGGSRFTVPRDTSMPAILTETGFYTNREQLEYLLDSNWREIIAAAHVEAIKEIEEMGPKFFQS
jgi:N-acetylmuramoyl-L-alanine amidase